MVASEETERRLPKIPRRRLFTIDEFDHMMQEGVFCEDDPIRAEPGSRMTAWAQLMWAALPSW